MTIDEKTLIRQIDMNNGWPSVAEVETEAYNLFKDRLKDGQVLLPVKINKDAAFETFGRDKHLAKIFSSMLDTYNQLPFHPDLAFDSAWRCLEYSMKLYAQRAWREKADMKLDDLFSRFSKEVFESLMNSDIHFQTAFDSIVNNISLPALKYMTLRLYYPKDLSVAPQITFVRGRAESILGIELLASLHDAYKGADGSLDAMGVNNIARRFDRLFQGKDINAGDVTFKPIQLEKRIELLISVLLYSCRCERFHGDIYSPLKSSKATLKTYYEYYFLTLCCLYFFWLQMFKLVEREDGLIQFVDSKEVETAISETIQQMNEILSKD